MVTLWVTMVSLLETIKGFALACLSSKILFLIVVLQIQTKEA